MPKTSNLCQDLGTRRPSGSDCQPAGLDKQYTPLLMRDGFVMHGVSPASAIPRERKSLFDLPLVDRTPELFMNQGWKRVEIFMFPSASN